MEDTIKKHINFISLESATLSYISLNISKELAFSICAYAVESGEVTASKILQLWMGKLGAVYSFEDFSEVDWRHLALCCQNCFERVTHADESSNIDGVSCKLCCWLKSSYDFLETVQRKAKKVNLSGLCLFLSFILETAQKCCTFFRLNANSVKWKSQNELVNSVHNLSQNLVWGLLDSVEEADDVAYCSIIPFINRICLSSMQNTCLDIKTKVEIWKYAAKFTLRYESCSHIGPKNDRTESEWPKSAMNLLIFEIKRNLLVIYNKDLNEDVQYVEKYLRVTGFYLKILYEMTTVFQHSNFPVANELFDVLLLTISAPDFIKMSNAFTFVKKHILNGIINILPMMCKNGEFQQMVNDHVGESGSFSFELVMSYLHACISNDDIEFLSSNAELLTRILTRTFQVGELFVDASRFDEIIDIYATLTHLDSTQSLLRKMQQLVLKGNSALSFACTEVLILVSSLNDRIDEVKSHIEFWNQVDDQFTQLSSNCKRLNVERLIINKNMLCMNQRSNSIHQVQICSLSKHSLYNHHTLSHTTDRNYCIEYETCNRKIASNLRKLIERFECNEISVEDHYEIVNAMYKLARCRAVIPKDLQQKIEDFVKKIIDAWTRNHKYAFKRVLSAGFVLIATSTNEMQFKILTCIKKCLESGVRLSVMGFWIFLRACCKQQKDLDLYKIAQSIIADTEIPNIVRVSMFENIITQCANNRTVDMQHYSHIESLSKCTTCIKPYFPHRKRLRRENDYEENDLEDLVQNVCRTLKKILPLSKQLKQSEVEKLTNICSDIKTIADSHHNKS